MPQPSTERMPNNPWPEWPFTLAVDYGQEESIALFGRDPRLYLTTATKFAGDDSGCLQEVHTIQVKWEKDATGRMVCSEVPGTEKVLPAQLVLIAMGFVGPEDTLLNQLGVERDARSNAKADYGQFATNVEGVFAAGDMRRGQSLVVWAIDEGRGVAREVDSYLMGKTNLP
jgi:glutamate synthase (NADPH/NADH) small chain